eukprot:scaffold34082_cov62-Phaeocystis_antarctica.AAC.5
MAKPYIAVTAGASGSEGADGGDPVPPNPEPPKSASAGPATTECAICLDDNAEYAAVGCHVGAAASAPTAPTRYPMPRDRV